MQSESCIHRNITSHRVKKTFVPKVNERTHLRFTQKTTIPGVAARGVVGALRIGVQE